MRRLLLACLLVCCAAIAAPAQDGGATNTRPLVGILSQPDEHLPEGASSYIAASYVKLVEASGARAVPILCNATTAQLTNLFHSVNALLLPGGSASIAPGSPFREVHPGHRNVRQQPGGQWENW
eukprot:scaffold7830_cov376-Prasinococcus_capsulatus_cf.AAC.5